MDAMASSRPYHLRIGACLSCVLAAVLSTFGESSAAMMCDPAVMPLPERQATEVQMEPPLAESCSQLVYQRIAVVSLVLAQPLFTYSPTWGEIVRIDLGSSPERYSRVICFRRTANSPVQMGMYDLTKVACQAHLDAFTLYPPGAGDPSRR
jgi:hypothetical protein